MFNAANIAKMKGVRIVNAARGELIDETDLTEAIQSGQVAGAGLDVFAEEPPKNKPLTGLANVMSTPHSRATAEAQEELGTQVAVQIRDYLTDGIIRNAVNLPALSADQYRRCGRIWLWRNGWVRLCRRRRRFVPRGYGFVTRGKWRKWARTCCGARCWPEF